MEELPVLGRGVAGVDSVLDEKAAILDSCYGVTKAITARSLLTGIAAGSGALIVRADKRTVVRSAKIDDLSSANCIDQVVGVTSPVDGRNGSE